LTLQHDGWREHHEWPALNHGYGIGDGAFYAKHVRCGDLFALILLLRRLGNRAVRLAGKTLLRRDASDRHYLFGMVSGIRRGAQLDVDRGQRLYRLTADPARSALAVTA
jgi:hypothetical protein